MDASRFTEAKTGELVRIKTPDGPDWAFIPHPLPPDWKLPQRLVRLLVEASSELARLDEKGRTVANPTLLLQPLRKREALRSSSLEGTYATPKELLLFELNPREPTSSSDPAYAWREVFNYDQALKFGSEKLTDDTPAGLPLCNRLITAMHGILMAGTRGQDKGAGEIRNRQVHIGSGNRYIPPPPQAVAKCMAEFESFLNRDHGDLDPLVVSYLVHYQFEAIHPFLDGNGRVGRSLLSLTTFKWSGLHLPWLYMSAYFERYKDEYVDNMFRVSANGDWDRWIEFCLRGTRAQCRDALARCDKLNALRERMHETLSSYPRMHKIVECLFQSPIFTPVQVAEWTETSQPTARADIAKLVKTGFVAYLEGLRPRSYFVPAIFEIAYREDQDEPEGPNGAPVTGG